MLERTLEPEVMDDPDEAAAYDDMGHDGVNQLFVADLLASGDIGRNVMDVGTGTAQIPIALCQAHADCRVLAVDAAVSMLEIARNNVLAANLEQRINLAHHDARAVTWNDEPFDTLISNSLIHHVPDPAAVLVEMLKHLRPGGRIFIRDLYRPADAATVEHLVSTYASDETQDNQQLLRQSFHAALTLDEIREIVTQLGFAAESVNLTSDRHWTWNAIQPKTDS